MGIAEAMKSVIESAPMANSTEPAVVSVTHFVKRYKKHMAVDDVQLMIKRGEIYGREVV